MWLSWWVRNVSFFYPYNTKLVISSACTLWTVFINPFSFKDFFLFLSVFIIFTPLTTPSLLGFDKPLTSTYRIVLCVRTQRYYTSLLIPVKTQSSVSTLYCMCSYPCSCFPLSHSSHSKLIWKLGRIVQLEFLRLWDIAVF